MSAKTAITKENLDEYLKELGKQYRKLNGKSVPVEIVLIGGASVLANYGFRDLTYDVDVIFRSSASMKQAAINVREKFNLPDNWLNSDFTATASYSEKLLEASIYYKEFANVLTVRTISAEYLLAMKLMSGREYKRDLSDVAGILLEHKQNNAPINRDKIEQAIVKLYGKNSVIPPNSVLLLDKAFKNQDYETLYHKYLETERNAKDVLMNFKEKYPAVLTAENIGDVLNSLRKKKPL